MSCVRPGERRADAELQDVALAPERECRTANPGLFALLHRVAQVAELAIDHVAHPPEVVVNLRVVQRLHLLNAPANFKKSTAEAAGNSRKSVKTEIKTERLGTAERRYKGGECHPPQEVYFYNYYY